MGNVSNNESTKTVLIISVGFTIVFFLTKIEVFLLIGIIVGLLGILSTFLAGFIHFGWMKLTWLLSKIVPNILLTVLFFLFLFPIAILSRLFSKKDPLKLKNNSDSIYVEVNKVFDKESLENPW